MTADVPDFPTELLRLFYLPFCTPSEVDRVLSPATAADFLLGIRAQYIADHMRVFRYFRRQRALRRMAYSLEDCFPTDHYKIYFASLPEQDRSLLQRVCYGDVYTAEADGEIFVSPFGPIVTISGSLRHFLEFGHLAMGAFYREVPLDVRFRALIIALRVMFGYESLDFDADPRGIIDPFISEQMQDSISMQMQFIVGHEFGHYFLGHLSEDQTHPAGRRAALGQDTEACVAYNTSQQQEFDADLDALMRPRLSNELRGIVINATFMWFGMVELYEHARDIIAPMPAWRRSHPSARDRHLRIQSTLRNYLSNDFIENSSGIIRAVDFMREKLTEYLSLHIDVFETYGSMYLSDEPNTEWRGPLKVDREDY
jgi:hypothetical protein